MPTEIERKFLVNETLWTPKSKGFRCTQGYLFSDPSKVVRVRTMGMSAFLTIKGKTTGVSRPEYEYKIPYDDAIELLTMCDTNVIVKTRHIETHHEEVWEIDVFDGDDCR